MLPPDNGSKTESYTIVIILLVVILLMIIIIVVVDIYKTWTVVEVIGKTVDSVTPGIEKTIDSIDKVESGKDNITKQLENIENSVNNTLIPKAIRTGEDIKNVVGNLEKSGNIAYTLVTTGNF